ncbi:MAG: hypothetical protein AAF928_18215 [Myxococcota bacterium]
MMENLEHVLADGVIEALRARDHIAFSPEAEDALNDELVLLITPSVAMMGDHLEAERAQESRAVAQGSLGHGHTEEAVVELAEHITDRLLQSDHVEDVFAADRMIRRDVLRALRTQLLAYLRGEVVLASHRTILERFEVTLAELGYVVRGVCERADPSTIHHSLVVAANVCGGRLCSLEISMGVAIFELPGGAEAGRLALEEAITGEMMGLVRAGVVPLPSIEQLLEISPDVPGLSGFRDAIARAELRTRHTTGCEATCRLLDETTVLVSVIPLSKEAAAEAHDHFSRFLELLEEALDGLPNESVVGASAGASSPEGAVPRPSDRADHGDDDDPTPVEHEPESTSRRRRRQRREDHSAAPKSEPRKKRSATKASNRTSGTQPSSHGRSGKGRSGNQRRAKTKRAK